jgi:hypothetical protein
LYPEKQCLRHGQAVFSVLAAHAGFAREFLITGRFRFHRASPSVAFSFLHRADRHHHRVPL